MQDINCTEMVLQSWRFRSIHPLRDKCTCLTDEEAHHFLGNLSLPPSHGTLYPLTSLKCLWGSDYVPSYLLSVRGGTTHSWVLMTIFKCRLAPPSLSSQPPVWGEAPPPPHLLAGLLSHWRPGTAGTFHPRSGYIFVAGAKIFYSWI